MNDNQKKITLYMIHIALIEIRASKDQRVSSIIADIFHNCPMAVANEASFEEIMSRCAENAARLGGAQFFDQIVSVAMERFPEK